MSNRPRTDALFEKCKNKSNIECMAELEELCRTIEGELAEAKKQRDELAARFTRLDEPRYSGKPMLDLVLSVRNPEFDAWVASLPPTYWARYDLSAVRIGWEAAKTAGKTSSHEP
jgi:hypothetical protein